MQRFPPFPIVGILLLSLFAIGGTDSLAQSPSATLLIETPRPQCLDFNQDKICEYVVLTNGTMVANPSVRNVTLQSIAVKSQNALLPENGTTTTTVLQNGTIVENSTSNPPSMVLNQDLCYDGGFSDGINYPFSHTTKYNEIQDKECTKLGYPAV